MQNLRSKLIRLAYAKPTLRPQLLPLLKAGRDKAAGDDCAEAQKRLALYQQAAMKVPVAHAESRYQSTLKVQKAVEARVKIEDSTPCTPEDWKQLNGVYADVRRDLMALAKIPFSKFYQEFHVSPGVLRNVKSFSNLDLQPQAVDYLEGAYSVVTSVAWFVWAESRFVQSRVAFYKELVDFCKENGRAPDLREQMKFKSAR